jgi:ferredoxin
LDLQIIKRFFSWEDFYFSLAILYPLSMAYASIYYMKKVKITLKQESCIGCGVCREIAPGFFDSNENHQTTLVNGKEVAPKVYEVSIEVEDELFAKLEDAKSSCPMSGIVVEEI